MRRWSSRLFDHGWRCKYFASFVPGAITLADLLALLIAAWAPLAKYGHGEAAAQVSCICCKEERRCSRAAYGMDPLTLAVAAGFYSCATPGKRPLVSALLRPPCYLYHWRCSCNDMVERSVGLTDVTFVRCVRREAEAGIKMGAAPGTRVTVEVNTSATLIIAVGATELRSKDVNAYTRAQKTDLKSLAVKRSWRGSE